MKNDVRKVSKILNRAFVLILAVIILKIILKQLSEPFSLQNFSLSTIMHSNYFLCPAVSFSMLTSNFFGASIIFT